MGWPRGKKRQKAASARASDDNWFELAFGRELTLDQKFKVKEVAHVEEASTTEDDKGHHPHLLHGIEMMGGKIVVGKVQQ